MDRLWQIAFDRRAPEALQVQAAVHLLNRLLGPPVKMLVTASHDELSMITDDELAAEIRASRESILRADASQNPYASALSQILE